MALIESTRARLHPTPAERLALALATWISVGVGWRRVTIFRSSGMIKDRSRA